MDQIPFIRVRGLCEERGVSMAKLERDLGMPQALIRKWKKDQMPSLRSLVAISEYFNVSVDYLLGKEDKMPDVDSEKEYKDTIISMQRAKENLSPQKYQRMVQMIKQTIDFCFNDKDEN